MITPCISKTLWLIQNTLQMDYPGGSVEKIRVHRRSAQEFFHVPSRIG